MKRKRIAAAVLSIMLTMAGAAGLLWRFGMAEIGQQLGILRYKRTQGGQ